VTRRGVSCWWGQLHCIGLFGDVVMILFLTKPSILHLYRLFSGGDLLVAPMVAPLETVALEIANRGWKHNLRIGLDYFPFIFSPNSTMDGFVL